MPDNEKSDIYKDLPKSGGLSDYWYPVFCYLTLLSYIAVYLTFPNIWNFVLVSIIFLAITVISLRKVPVAHAGVILRFGRRIVDTKKSKDGNIVFLFKREGYFLIFPIPVVENVIFVSMEPKSGVINKDTLIKQLKEIDDQEKAKTITAEEAAKKRSEIGKTVHSIMTAEGVGIIPQIPYAYRVGDPGKVVGLEGGVTRKSEDLSQSEWYESVFLKNFVPEMILSAARGILGTMTLREALSKKITNEKGEEIPIGDGIKDNVEGMGNWDDFGAKILLIRVENIFAAPGSESAFKELQDVIEAEYDYEEKLKRADMDKEMRRRAAEAGYIEKEQEAKGIRVLVEVNRFRVEQEAIAQAEFERRQMLVYLGKKEDDEITPGEAEEYRRFKMGYQLAKSVDNNATFLSIPEFTQTLGRIGEIFSKKP